MFCNKPGEEAQMTPLQIDYRIGLDRAKDASMYPYNSNNKIAAHIDCIARRSLSDAFCPACNASIKLRHEGHQSSIHKCSECGHEVALARCYYCGLSVPRHSSVLLANEYELLDEVKGRYSWHKSCSQEDPAFRRISALQEDRNRQDSSSCFIATAVYGSSCHPSVVILRKLRDEVLVQSAFGAYLINVYYCLSPGLAKSISNKPLLKAALSIFLLDPLISILRFFWPLV
jgi:Zn ribbon nucleic-acid-binding protein